MYAPTREELRLLLDIIAGLHHCDSSRHIRQQMASMITENAAAQRSASAES